jgi:hypothetical protein
LTICVSVRVAEGLVMAADSAAILQGEVNGQRGVVQTYSYATKVSQARDFPMGVMSWGLGSINSRSIQSLIMEWENGYTSKAKFQVKRVADDLLTFILDRYDAAYPNPTQEQTLGMFVGGYSDGEFFSKQYSCELPGERAWQEVRPDLNGQPDFGANWYGATDALVRLILGFDGNALQALINRGVDPQKVQQWVDAHDPGLPLVFAGMPLQDAIDFAEWAATVVIGRWRFAPGVSLVGGDIDIAVVRPGNFDWAQRKRWSIKQ